MIKQYGTTHELRLVVQGSGAILASYAFEDENIGHFKQGKVGGDILQPITVAGSYLLVPPPSKHLMREPVQLAIYNDGSNPNVCSLEETDGINTVKRWSRDLQPGELAEYNPTQGWTVFAMEGGVQVISPGPGGGGGTVDTTARNLVNQLTTKMTSILKVAGNSIAPGSEVFVQMADGSVVNYVNKTAAAIVIPAAPTKANMVTAGLTELAANATDNRLGEIYKFAGDTVTAGSEVTIKLDSGNVVNYKNPTAGGLVVPTPATDAAILAAGFTGIAAKENHLHSILASASTIGSSDTIFKAAGGKLWRNKILNPDTKLQPTDLTWGDNFILATSDPTLDYTVVADNDTLAINSNNLASPPLNVVFHVQKPAPAVGGWLNIVNTGKGVIDVDGTQILDAGALEYTASADGTAWVLTSREGTAPGNTDTEITQIAVVTARNTIANLLYPPKGPVYWEVNGVTVDLGITNAGQVVTYNPAVVGYNIDPGTDSVQANYYY